MTRRARRHARANQTSAAVQQRAALLDIDWDIHEDYDRPDWRAVSVFLDTFEERPPGDARMLPVGMRLRVTDVPTVGALYTISDREQPSAWEENEMRKADFAAFWRNDLHGVALDMYDGWDPSMEMLDPVAEDAFAYIGDPHHPYNRWPSGQAPEDSAQADVVIGALLAQIDNASDEQIIEYYYAYEAGGSEPAQPNPLRRGFSPKVIRHNVAEMLAAGHSQRQAYAAAYRSARKSYRARHPRKTLPRHMRVQPDREQSA